MDIGWDKKLHKEFRDKQGLTFDQASAILGIVAEERQKADREGYTRGYNTGHEVGYKRAIQQETGANSRHLDRGTY